MSQKCDTDLFGCRKFSEGTLWTSKLVFVSYSRTCTCTYVYAYFDMSNPADCVKFMYIIRLTTFALCTFLVDASALSLYDLYMLCLTEVCAIRHCRKLKRR